MSLALVNRNGVALSDTDTPASTPDDVKQPSLAEVAAREAAKQSTHKRSSAEGVETSEELLAKLSVVKDIRSMAILVAKLLRMHGIYNCQAVGLELARLSVTGLNQ